MRYTYTDLLSDFLQSIGAAGSTDTTLLDFFKRHLVRRYQQAFAEITNGVTQQQRTASTVAAQQYYHYPVGIVNIETATITIGSIAYPMITVDSQLQWDAINQTLITTTALPRFIFPRRDDFGVWPIPQAVYTITLNYHIRDRSLTVADYTTGTVAVTNNTTAVVGTGTTWTSAMIGRWFIMDDPTKQGEGYWYRIVSVTDTTHLTLETSYEGVAASGATYRIGESPELPEEIHPMLSAGVISDYYAGPRKDLQAAQWFNNVFWTGDGKIDARDGTTFTDGILGAKQRYSGRDDGAIVWKHGLKTSFTDRLWATMLSNS